MFKQEIIDKKFSRAFNGYDVAEVDYFLDELYRELTFRDREEAALQTQIDELRSELDTIRRSLSANSEEVETEELCFLEEHTQEYAQEDQKNEMFDEEALSDENRT